MSETRSVDRVCSVERRASIDESSSSSRALEYIEELLGLLTQHENVQISENISEEFENIKVRVKRTRMSLEHILFPANKSTSNRLKKHSD